MANFRIIGIKTGKKLTDSENLPITKDFEYKYSYYNYLKNLNENTEFLFFNDFEISENSKVLSYYPEKRISNLFSLSENQNTTLNISSIVGQNGSGKSSLMEIIYLAIFNISVELGLLEDANGNTLKIPTIYLRCELFFLVNENLANL